MFGTFRDFDCADFNIGLPNARLESLRRASGTQVRVVKPTVLINLTLALPVSRDLAFPSSYQSRMEDRDGIGDGGRCYAANAANLPWRCSADVHQQVRFPFLPRSRPFALNLFFPSFLFLFRTSATRPFQTVGRRAFYSFLVLDHSRSIFPSRRCAFHSFLVLDRSRSIFLFFCFSATRPLQMVHRNISGIRRTPKLPDRRSWLGGPGA